jgi:hypothetical protein
LPASFVFKILAVNMPPFLFFVTHQLAETRGVLSLILPKWLSA